MTNTYKDIFLFIFFGGLIYFIIYAHKYQDDTMNLLLNQNIKTTKKRINKKVSFLDEKKTLDDLTLSELNSDDESDYFNKDIKRTELNSHYGGNFKEPKEHKNFKFNKVPLNESEHLNPQRNNVSGRTDGIDIEDMFNNISLDDDKTMQEIYDNATKNQYSY